MSAINIKYYAIVIWIYFFFTRYTQAYLVAYVYAETLHILLHKVAAN